MRAGRRALAGGGWYLLRLDRSPVTWRDLSEGLELLLPESPPHGEKGEMTEGKRAGHGALAPAGQLATSRTEMAGGGTNGTAGRKPQRHTKAGKGGPSVTPPSGIISVV